MLPETRLLVADAHDVASALALAIHEVIDVIHQPSGRINVLHLL